MGFNGPVMIRRGEGAESGQGVGLEGRIAEKQDVSVCQDQEELEFR